MACPIQSSYPTGWEADRPDFCYNVAPAEPSHKFDVVARGTDAGYDNRAPDGAARRRTSESAGSGSSSFGEVHRTWAARRIPPSDCGKTARHSVGLGRQMRRKVALRSDRSE